MNVLPSMSSMVQFCARRNTRGCGSYAWKLEGTPSGKTFLARAFAACEPTVRSAYVRSSRCVIALALSAKLWCNVFFVADMNITPINGLMSLYFRFKCVATGKCFPREVGSFGPAWQTEHPLGGRSSVG